MPPTFLLRSHGLVGLLLLLLLGVPVQCPESDPRPRAVVAPDRSEHLLDRPYPSAELRNAAGWVELEGFPLPPPGLGQNFLRGWLRQVASSVSGFSAMTPVYFRFEAEPALREAYPGRPGDPVQLFSLDSRHRVPVRVRFVEDARGDPYLRDGALLVMPDERHPLRLGERYAAVVSRRVARRAPGWSPPAGLPDFVARGAAVATVFRVHDGAEQLETLRAAADAVLDADPSLLQPPDGLREVSSLRYEQGTTPSGTEATLEIVTFANGGQEVTFLEAESGAPPVDVDLTGPPMRVFQTSVRTVTFQDPEGRPWQSPGLGIIFDTERSDGWMPFSPDGVLDPATIGTEEIRVVVQVPREGRDHAMVLWGHGSGGDAYESVQRTDPANDMPEIRARVAERGAILLGSDQPLFGRRFPLVEEGFDDNLTLVNIPNLPAFRDNVRQGAVDQHVLVRFARDVLPGLLEAEMGHDVVDPRRIGYFGHSVGAEITAVAAPLHARDLDGILINGTSGFKMHSVLASDLFRLEGTVGEAIFALAGIPVPEDPTPAETLGALFGVPEAAVDGIDRFHPLGQPFQLIIDPSDPLSLAPEHPTPITVFFGEGDTFVPPDGPVWLADASRDGELVTCTPGGDFNGHFCVFREETGFRAYERLVDGL